MDIAFLVVLLVFDYLILIGVSLCAFGLIGYNPCILLSVIPFIINIALVHWSLNEYDEKKAKKKTIIAILHHIFVGILVFGFNL